MSGVLRRSLKEFAELQEEVLKKNDHKGGWQRMNNLQLLKRLKEEVEELTKAVHRNDKPDIRKECADVANFAMMIADNNLLALNRPWTQKQVPKGGVV